MLSATTSLQGIAAAGAAFLGSVFFNAAYPLARRTANLVAVAILMFAQVVLGTIVLSEMRAISLTDLLVYHLACLLVSIILWVRRGKKDPRVLYRFRKEEVLGLVRLSPPFLFS